MSSLVSSTTSTRSAFVLRRFMATVSSTYIAYLEFICFLCGLHSQHLKACHFIGFFLQLQYRTLHSSFGFGNKYNKCCLLKCLNTWQSFHLFRSLPGACRFNSRYISSFLPLDRGIKLASLNSILFPRRYFFYVSKAANEEKRGNSFPFKFKKSWIQTKALASARKNQDVNMVTSASEQLVEDAKEGVTQKSKVNNKTKQPPRSKKSKEQLSAATASEQATVEKSPTLASKVSSS